MWKRPGVAARRTPTYCACFVSAFELSLVFLTALLLSPITFTTHMVSLLFVYATFLSVPRTGLTFPAQAALALAVVAMAIT